MRHPLLSVEHLFPVATELAIGEVPCAGEVFPPLHRFGHPPAVRNSHQSARHVGANLDHRFHQTGARNRFGPVALSKPKRSRIGFVKEHFRQRFPFAQFLDMALSAVEILVVAHADK